MFECLSTSIDQNKQSLNSFLRNVHLKRVKKQTYSIKNQINRQIVPAYINKGISILQLSKTYNFPPALLSRSIMDKITTLPKKKLSEAMRDPIGKLNSLDILSDPYRASPTSSEGHCHSSNKGAANNSLSAGMERENLVMDPFSGQVIQYSQTEEPVTRLAKEVQEAICMDPLYGPRSDRERQIIGMEYEIVLEQIIRSMSEFVFIVHIVHVSLFRCIYFIANIHSTHGTKTKLHSIQFVVSPFGILV